MNQEQELIIIKEEDEYVDCGCGCGKPMLKYTTTGKVRGYIQGHKPRKNAGRPKSVKINNEQDVISSNERVAILIRKTRTGIILRKGGRCKNCNTEYNGSNGSIFQLHHVDGSTKEFSLSGQSLLTRSWIEIEEEINKCELYCANCHFMLHSQPY